MPTTRELERAIATLSLAEREYLLSAIEGSISDEYDRLAAASVAEDMRRIERYLAQRSLTPEQKQESPIRGDASVHGDTDNLPWDQISQAIPAELRRK